jgi:hypothetical protein
LGRLVALGLAAVAARRYRESACTAIPSLVSVPKDRAPMLRFGVPGISGRATRGAAVRRRPSSVSCTKRVRHQRESLLNQSFYRGNAVNKPKE